jgi:hypothetical protein
MNAFEAFSDDARLWLIAAAQPLSETQASKLQEEMDEILGRWKRHGEVLSSDWTLLENQILAVAEPTMSEKPSGCAIDSMLKMVHKLTASLGIEILDPTTLVLARVEGRIRTIQKADLAARIEEGILNADTPILDLALLNLGQLRHQQLEKALGQTWIGRKYKVGAGV